MSNDEYLNIIVFLTVGQLYRESVQRRKEAEYAAWRDSLRGVFRGPFTTKPPGDIEEVMRLRQAIIDETATIVHHHTLPGPAHQPSFWDLVVWIQIADLL